MVNRKHCLSPSFLSDREPRRTLLSMPRSLLDGSWMREPGRRERERESQESGELDQNDVVERGRLTLSDEGLACV